MTEKFSAVGQTLGYLYQLRLALLLFLESDRKQDLAIESLDDIQFEENGEARELV